MSEELMIAAFFLVFGAFEFFDPAQSGQSTSGRLRNLIYGAFVLSIGAFSAAIIFNLLPGEVRILDTLSGPALAAYVLVYVFLTDLLFYWYHRAQHAFYVLWSLHELHHSDEELNVISSYRTYWLDYPVQAVVVNAPVMYLMGFNVTGVMLAVAVLTFFLTFSHTNMRLHLGWFSKVIVGPQLHRIHHSRLPQHRDKNLAQVFPIFDVLFGTYYPPAKDEYPPTGTDTLATDASFAQTLVRPVSIWRKVLRSVTS